MAEIRKNTTVVVRLPPSPTGYLQVGNMRTFLFNYLYAKKNGGKILLRMEDTDRERSKPEFEKAIKEDLAWLGITYDEEHRQSERASIHKKYLERLIADGKAYVSKEEREEGKRGEVIRFKNPGTEVSFEDAIRGTITMHTADLGDFVIAKDFNTPLYHLAVVIDDYEMGVTDVLRGEDHISNTPRQILLLEAIGAAVPRYAHFPLMLAADRSKLSKRNGSVSIRELRAEGYLPEAVINALAMIGWTPGSGAGEEQELFSLSDLVSLFDLSELHSSGAVWNTEKLQWFNRQYLKKLPFEEVSHGLLAHLPGPLKSKAEQAPELWRRLVPVLSERAHYFGEVVDLAGKGEVLFFFDRPAYEPKELVWKNEDEDTTTQHIEWVKGAVDNFEQHDFNVSSISDKIMPYADEKGRGSVLWPMRFALSGQKRSPDPFTIAYILGRDETLARLDSALKMLKQRSG